jgi:hypothetical protein
MMIPTVIMIVMAAVAAVSAAFGLEGGLHLDKIRSEAMEHIFDHMVGPNAKNLVSNFSRQMSISQMPGKAHELIRIFMPDFDNRLRSGLNLEPPSIFKLQAISIGHRDRFRKVEKDIFALIRSQANAAAMPSVKIESESACRLLPRPQPGGSMN